MAEKYIQQDEGDEPHETVIIKENDNKGRGTGWIILAVVLLVIFVLFFLAKSVLDNSASDGNIEINTPTPNNTNIQLPEPNPNPTTNNGQ